MNHIDEHTLELFVLGSAEVQDQVQRIQAHLEECEGCTAHALRLRALYRSAETAYEQLGHSVDPATTLPMRRGKAADPVWLSDGGMMPARRHTAWAGMKAYSREHPFVATAGGAMFLLGLVSMFVFAISSVGTAVQQPAFAHPNPAQESIDVYARDRTKLWTLPALGVREWVSENDGNHASRLQVADLQGDGRNEVIVTAPLAGFASAQGRVRIFTDKSELYAEREIGGAVSFRGKPYAEEMNASAVIVVPAGKGAAEIIVTASAGRSPTVIARLDAGGNVLGEYWHFGNLYSLLAIDLDGDGEQEIIASGTSDIDDSVSGPGSSYPVLAILDRNSLRGRQESRTTPGFGFAPSTAERAYVRFPVSDLNEATQTSAGVLFVEMTKDSLLRVHVEGGPVDTPITFDYKLNFMLEVVAVNSSDSNAALHRRLRAEGVVQVDLDAVYLDRLKNETQVRRYR